MIACSHAKTKNKKQKNKKTKTVYKHRTGEMVEETYNFYKTVHTHTHTYSHMHACQPPEKQTQTYNTRNKSLGKITHFSSKPS